MNGQEFRERQACIRHNGHPGSYDIAGSSRHVDQDGIFRTSLEGEKTKAAWLYPGPPCGVLQDAICIHRLPGRKFLRVWEIIVSISSLYVGISVPLALGFSKLYFHEGACAVSADAVLGHASQILAMVVMDAISDLIFVTDIFFHFLSAVWLVSNDGMPHWVLVDDLSSIRKLYVRDNFILDLISAVPYQYLECINFGALGARAQGWAIPASLRSLSLLKLLRLRRVQRLLSALVQRAPKLERAITLSELLLSLILASHWFGCIFFYVAYGLGDPNGDGYSRFLFDNGWVYKDGILNSQGSESGQHSGSPWLSSWYWALSTLTQLGYADISPSTSEERVVASLAMCMGCLYFVWISARFTSICSKRPALELSFDAHMEHVDEFLRVWQLPLPLHAKVQAAVAARFPTRRRMDANAVLNSLELPLREEVRVQVYRDVLSQVPLFHLCSSETLTDLCLRLRTALHLPGDVIAQEGTKPDALYIVRCGLVEVSAGGVVLEQAGSGSLVGAMALFGVLPGGLRACSAVAKTACELCVLSAADLDAMVTSDSPSARSLSRLVEGAAKSHVAGLRKTLETTGCLPRERYLRMDWDSIVEDLKRHDLYILAELQRNARRRMRARLLEVAGRRLQQRSDAYEQILQTVIRLNVESISGLEPYREVAGLVCVVHWPAHKTQGAGVAGCFEQDETLVVSGRANEAGTLRMQRDLQIVLAHPAHVRWKEMPPLVVTVCLVPEGRLTRAGYGCQRRRRVIFSNRMQGADTCTLGAAEKARAALLPQAPQRLLLPRVSSDAPVAGSCSLGARATAEGKQGTTLPARKGRKFTVRRDGINGRRSASLGEGIRGIGLPPPLPPPQADGQVRTEDLGAGSGAFGQQRPKVMRARVLGARFGMVGSTPAPIEMTSPQMNAPSQVQSQQLPHGVSTLTNTKLNMNWWHKLRGAWSLSGRGKEEKEDKRDDWSSSGTRRNTPIQSTLTACDRGRSTGQEEMTHKSCAIMEFTASMFRQLPVKSRWYDVMETIKAKHPSPFFKRKRRQLVGAIHAQQEAMLETARHRRLQALPWMKSRTTGPDDRAKEAGKTLIHSLEATGLAHDGGLIGVESKPHPSQPAATRSATAGEVGRDSSIPAERGPYMFTEVQSRHSPPRLTVGKRQAGLSARHQDRGLVQVIKNLCDRVDRQADRIEALESTLHQALFPASSLRENQTRLPLDTKLDALERHLRNVQQRQDTWEQAHGGLEHEGKSQSGSRNPVENNVQQTLVGSEIPFVTTQSTTSLPANGLAIIRDSQETMQAASVQLGKDMEQQDVDGEHKNIAENQPDPLNWLKSDRLNDSLNWLSVLESRGEESEVRMPDKMEPQCMHKISYPFGRDRSPQLLTPLTEQLEKGGRLTANTPPRSPRTPKFVSRTPPLPPMYGVQVMPGV